MDDQFLEKIDSLWFFSSVLSQSSQILSQNAQNSLNNHEHSDAEKQEQALQEQTARKEPSRMDPNVRGDHSCKEIADLTKRREKRKGKKTKKRVEKWIEESCAGMELEERTPFAVLYDSQIRNNRSNERVGTDTGFRHLTMPLVRDDLAMKEHLRSWAYAVASSVR